MTQYRIAYEHPGWRLMVSTNGLDETPRGPRWPTVREASRFYDSTVAIEYVSPLREEGDGVLTGPPTFFPERSEITLPALTPGAPRSEYPPSSPDERDPGTAGLFGDFA